MKLLRALGPPAMKLLRALEQLHAAGSPLGPDELAELRELVDAAIDGDIRVQNAGERDAMVSYAAGNRMHGWLVLRTQLDAWLDR